MGEIVYSRKGTGDPLVLIHGIGHRKEAWNPVSDRLAAHHDVIVLDLPGFGASGQLPRHGRDRMDHLADALETFFAELGIDRPHVVGNSLGGAIALELAARGSVRSATALSPAGFWTEGGRLWAFAVLMSIRLSAFMPSAVAQQIARRRWARGLAMASLHTHGRRLAPDAFLADLRALRECTAFNRVLRAGARYAYRTHPTVPATIAWGTKDRILLPSQATRARTLLPNVTHVPLPGAGHVPMIDEPELVTRVILEQVRSA
ncbi:MULTISPECIES: alpha/beta fold hydrolase [Mumia]|uniref:alpha/beta fold hydrolase n=1 Tax=Mumia TaxID=1546255 RepID=UPI00141F265D|nr:MULTISPECIES: alpha/beta fold hydrolase [unclassified Mumia]QMW66223.1 alpha/beta fold hydrolase [Mumia sp. ZJ1417]